MNINLDLLGMKKEIVSNIHQFDEKLWVPQPGAPEIQFQPLLFDTSQGLFANILRTRKKGILNKHRHHGTVHGYVLKGSWRYLEHDWIATEGTFVYEPPGEIHTLYSDSEEESMTLFIISGGLTFLDENNNQTSFMDVFTKIEACEKHYASMGLPKDTILKFIR